MSSASRSTGHFDIAAHWVTLYIHLIALTSILHIHIHIVYLSTSASFGEINLLWKIRVLDTTENLVVY